MKEPALPDKLAARRSFTRAAPTFDAAAVLHREVGGRLLEHLDPIRIAPKRIVDLGCGTGGALGPLGKRYPAAKLVGVDSALALIARARGRDGWVKRTIGKGAALVCADAEQLPFAHGTIDFVFSNLALHWSDPRRAFPEAARVLPVGGLFMFSTFGPDTLKELRSAWRAVDASSHVHDFIDMHDLGDALVHAGFADPVMEMEHLTLEYASVDDLARDLRGTGATNALPGRSRGLVTPRRWKQMAQGYEAHRRGEALPATFEIVYGHAWKTAAKRAADGRQVIDFQPSGAR